MCFMSDLKICVIKINFIFLDNLATKSRGKIGRALFTAILNIIVVGLLMVLILGNFKSNLSLLKACYLEGVLW